MPPKILSSAGWPPLALALIVVLGLALRTQGAVLMPRHDDVLDIGPTELAETTVSGKYFASNRTSSPSNDVTTDVNQTEINKPEAKMVTKATDFDNKTIVTAPEVHHVDNISDSDLPESTFVTAPEVHHVVNITDSDLPESTAEETIPDVSSSSVEHHEYVQQHLDHEWENTAEDHQPPPPPSPSSDKHLFMENLKSWIKGATFFKDSKDVETADKNADIQMDAAAQGQDQNLSPLFKDSTDVQLKNVSEPDIDDLQITIVAPAQMETTPDTKQSERQRYQNPVSVSDVQPGDYNPFSVPNVQHSDQVPEGERFDGSCPPENECIDEGLHVYASSSEGLTIPARINLSIRCTITMPLNHTYVRVDWHTPQHAFQTESHRTVDSSGKDVDIPVVDQKRSFSKRMYVTNEVFEHSAKRTLTIISTLRVINVTVEQDSGDYVCSAGSHHTCCRHKAVVNVKVYSPPTHATDFAIICVVCFLEFIIILYCKTRQTRSKNADDEGLVIIDGGGGENGRPSRCSSSDDYEPLPRTTKEAESQQQQQYKYVKT